MDTCVQFYERYTITHNILGVGNFGRVYLAVDHENNDVEVAIKRIDVSQMSENMLNQINTEIQLMKNLKHANIVHFYAHHHMVKFNYIYIILEYCTGGDFGKFLKNKPMKEMCAKYYIKQLKDALQYLNKNSIVHRDLKPENILMTNNKKRIKIADFGFAKKLNDKQLTTTVCGTPLYMAPEILCNGKYTNKSDLWSVGCIIYKLFYGRTLFEHATNVVKLVKLLNRPIKLPNKSTTVSQIGNHLLSKLLKREYLHRMSWEDFFSHKWFVDVEQDIDLNDLYHIEDQSIVSYGTTHINLNTSYDMGILFGEKSSEETCQEFTPELVEAKEFTPEPVEAKEFTHETVVWTDLMTNSPVHISINSNNTSKYMDNLQYDVHKYQSASAPTTFYHEPETSPNDFFGYVRTSFDMLRNSISYFNSV